MPGRVVAMGGSKAAEQFALPSFGASVQLIASHRGLAAEQELIEFLGLARLMQIYDGVEPGFSEAVEIARILRVPVSAFTVVDRGSVAELDTAFADLLHAAAGLPRERRADIARHITGLADDLRRSPAAGPGTPRMGTMDWKAGESHE